MKHKIESIAIYVVYGLCLILTLSLVFMGPEDSMWLKKNGFILQPKDTTEQRHYQFYARDVRIDFVIHKDDKADINVYSGSPLKWEYRVEYDDFTGRKWCRAKCELSSIYYVWLNEKTKD